MSKIKSLKIKQIDGSWTLVDIGANASNISYEDINVQTALDNIDLTKDGDNIVLTKPNGENINILSPEQTTGLTAVEVRDQDIDTYSICQQNGFFYLNGCNCNGVNLTSNGYLTVIKYANTYCIQRFSFVDSYSNLRHEQIRRKVDGSWGPWQVFSLEGHIHPDATTSTAGFMRADDKIKLNKITSDGENLYFCKTCYGGSSRYGMGFRIGPTSFGDSGADTFWICGNVRGDIFMGTQVNGATNATWYQQIKQTTNRVAWINWIEGSGAAYLAFAVDTAQFAFQYTNSDERLKNDIKDIDNKILNAVGKIKLRQFKMKENNPTNQWSFGIIAQEAIEAFEQEGLDIKDYSFVNTIETYSDGVQYYMVKYDQWNILRQAWLERELLSK